MQRFEYRVIPAPRRGEKAKGVKSTEDRFALALTNLMNEMGREGWDYVRADALPCDERVGLTGTKTTYQNMLVFRRAIIETPPEPVRALLAAPRADSPSPALKLGAAASPAGPAPSLGPARSDLVAE